MTKSSTTLWAAFAAFTVATLVLDPAPAKFVFAAPYAAGKIAIWAGFVCFLVYSIYCSAHESLFATIGKVTKLHWGRQIAIDLYIGLAFFIALIALNDGSLLTALLWTVPILLFGNLATLLYLAIHYDEIIVKLAG